MSLREKLKDRSHLRVVELATPALGEGSGVLVRDVTVGDRLRLTEACRKPTKDGGDVIWDELGFISGLIHLSVLDADDKEPLFSSAQEPLDLLDDATFNLLGVAAAKAAGLGKDAQKEALGNSEATPGGDSSSG